MIFRVLPISLVLLTGISGAAIAQYTGGGPVNRPTMVRPHTPSIEAPSRFKAHEKVTDEVRDKVMQRIRDLEVLDLEGMQIELNNDTVDPRDRFTYERFGKTKLFSPDIPASPQDANDYQIPDDKRTVPVDELRPRIEVYDWHASGQLAQGSRRDIMMADIKVLLGEDDVTRAILEQNSRDGVSEGDQGEAQSPQEEPQAESSIMESVEEAHSSGLSTSGFPPPAQDRDEVLADYFRDKYGDDLPEVLLLENDREDLDKQWMLFVDPDNPNRIEFSHFDGERWIDVYVHEFDRGDFSDFNLFMRIWMTILTDPDQVTDEDVRKMLEIDSFGVGNARVLSLIQTISEAAQGETGGRFTMAVVNAREVLGDNLDVEQHNIFLEVTYSYMEDGEDREFSHVFWLRQADQPRNQ